MDSFDVAQCVAIIKKVIGPAIPMRRKAVLKECGKLMTKEIRTEMVKCDDNKARWTFRWVPLGLGTRWYGVWPY